MIALHAGVMFCTEITDALWKRYLSQHPENLIDEDSSLLTFARFATPDRHPTEQLIPAILGHSRFVVSDTTAAAVSKVRTTSDSAGFSRTGTDSASFERISRY